MNQARHFFEQTIKKDRLSHLYLISGPKGSGKGELVDDIVYLLLTKDKTPSSHLKVQIKQRTLTNVMTIEPDGQMIKKEQIIALQQEFSKTALVSGPRIYVIKNVEKMNQSAANSLLKFMEEPLSAGVFGFLLTENIDVVIRTIISRSQVIHMNNRNEEDLENELLQFDVDERIATLAPYLTKDIEEATMLADDPNFLGVIDFIEGIAHAWHDQDISFPIYFATQGSFLLQDRTLFKNFLELLLLYFVDLIHYRANQPIVYQFLKEQIQTQSDAMKTFEINELITSIQDILKKQTYFINLELALDQLGILLEKKR